MRVRPRLPAAWHAHVPVHVKHSHPLPWCSSMNASASSTVSAPLMWNRQRLQKMRGHALHASGRVKLPRLRSKLCQYSARLDRF
jgi:alkylated DNA nucleotide flippase Atl1